MPQARDQRRQNARYYAANRDGELRRVRERQRATTEFLRRLREVPCSDCGIRRPACVMDFDHRDPSAKRFTLTSGRAALKSRTELQDEVAKCDVVCANCHRLRTRRRHREWLSTREPSTSPRIREHRERWRYHADLLDRIRSKPCADCGSTFAQCSMDFDHRDPAQKVRGVTRMICGSTAKLLAEVAKCDVVCANCHRLRTFNRRLTQGARMGPQGAPRQDVPRDLNDPNPAPA